MGSKQINLLHIEDDSVDRMVIERALKKIEGIGTIHNATNGEEALDLLTGENGKQRLSPYPQIILLDINMPKMNGIEFLKELRADEALKSCSVFIMTTSNDEQDKFEAYKLNVAGYVLKPLSFEKFVSAVSILNSYWKLCEHPELAV